MDALAEQAWQGTELLRQPARGLATSARRGVASQAWRGLSWLDGARWGSAGEAALDKDGRRTALQASRSTARSGPARRGRHGVVSSGTATPGPARQATRGTARSCGTRQGSAGEATPGVARHGEVGRCSLGMAWSGEPRIFRPGAADKASCGEARRRMARHGVAGVAWSGAAVHREVRRGRHGAADNASRGEAGRGLVLQGVAGDAAQGMACLDRVRQGSQGTARRRMARSDVAGSEWHSTPWLGTARCGRAGVDSHAMASRVHGSSRRGTASEWMCCLGYTGRGSAWRAPAGLAELPLLSAEPRALAILASSIATPLATPPRCVRARGRCFLASRAHGSSRQEAAEDQVRCQGMARSGSTGPRMVEQATLGMPWLAAASRGRRGVVGKASPGPAGTACRRIARLGAAAVAELGMAGRGKAAVAGQGKGWRDRARQASQGMASLGRARRGRHGAARLGVPGRHTAWQGATLRVERWPGRDRRGVGAAGSAWFGVATTGGARRGRQREARHDGDG